MGWFHHALEKVAGVVYAVEDASNFVQSTVKKGRRLIGKKATALTNTTFGHELAPILKPIGAFLGHTADEYEFIASVFDIPFQWTDEALAHNGLSRDDIHYTTHTAADLRRQLTRATGYEDYQFAPPIPPMDVRPLPKDTFNTEVVPQNPDNTDRLTNDVAAVSGQKRNRSEAFESPDDVANETHKRMNMRVSLPETTIPYAYAGAAPAHPIDLFAPGHNRSLEDETPQAKVVMSMGESTAGADLADNSQGVPTHGFIPRTGYNVAHDDETSSYRFLV